MKLIQVLMVYFWSIRNLRATMIYWRIHRTVKNSITNHISYYCYREHSRSNTVRLVPLPKISSHYHCEYISLENRIFTFLNKTLTLSINRQERRAQINAQPLLWQFHYCYHDYLIAIKEKDVTTIDDTIQKFIVQWIEDYPINAYNARVCAWHPYVISLRLESWLRLYSTQVRDESDTSKEFNVLLKKGIYRMARMLRRNLEYGTMGNHLMKNIKSLLFAGYALDSSYGTKILAKAERLLDREIQEQILTDGMHYERSPMYHVAMTSDIIDMYIVERNRNYILADKLKRVGIRMLAFLQNTIHPDGNICLFNDSILRTNIRADEVIQKGREIFGEINATAIENISVKQKDLVKKSGLTCIRNNKLYFVFDGGYIAPDYQPGHAHCDTLSYECSYMGRRVITDTGVFHYKESTERMYCRSTRAHNTIIIDGQDQSEIWKSFRVGKRAKPLFQSVVRNTNAVLIQGAHDGYERLQKGLIHERAVLIYNDSFLVVYDMVHGYGRHIIENRIHFHPDVSIEQKGKYLRCNNAQNGYSILSYGVTQPRIIQTEYYPAFGVKQTRNTLVYEEEVNLPFRMVYAVVFNGEPPRMEMPDSGILSITEHPNSTCFVINSLLGENRNSRL